MTSSSTDSTQARYQLYEVMRMDLPFEEKAERALALGKKYLGVENGHLTHIETNGDYWEAVVSTDPPDGEFPPGLVLDLASTYCRRTIGRDNSLSLADAASEGWEDDPAFEEHELATYHGSTISIEDELYGTVCFVSEHPREHSFTSDETMFAELIARMLEHEIHRERTAATIERLDQFAGVLSHDLRNPLTVAQGRLALVAEEIENEHVAKAAQALDRMETLITDVLTMTRQGREIEHPEPIALATVVEDCWESVATHGATIEVADDVTFLGDPSRIPHLFENLFRNAVEHGGSEVNVRVGQLVDRNGFYLEDDGPGIPEEHRQTIFESGYTTEEEGVGLGLAIVAGIVSAHHWSIRAAESPLGGARFEIYDMAIPR